MGRENFAYDHTVRSKLEISTAINNQANPRRKKYGDNSAPMKAETAEVNARRPGMSYIHKIRLITQKKYLLQIIFLNVWNRRPIFGCVQRDIGRNFRIDSVGVGSG